jgi:hypothetical protein
MDAILDSGHLEHLLVTSMIMIRNCKNGLLALLSDTAVSEGLQVLTSISLAAMKFSPKPAVLEPIAPCSEGLLLLPLDFTPLPHTVIVGIGRTPREHWGRLPTSICPMYSGATNKRTKKSKIVLAIVQHNAFVKNAKNCMWYKIDDAAVCAKVRYIFCNLLSDQYCSSSKSKVARCQQEQHTQASLKLEHALRMVYSVEMRKSLPAMIESTTMEPLHF